MKRFSVCALFAFLVSLGATPPCSAGSTVVGELVVTNSASNQFRIVDQAGYFHAPRGMSIEGLDGKPVIVDLSDNRQVLRITEKQIYIEPVESEYETVTGQLVLVDSTRGTFAIAGAPQTYVAPRNVDLQRYAGQRVNLFVDQRGQVLQIDYSDRADSADRGYPIPVSSCSYNGRGYGDGTTMCQTGTQYRCETGNWRSLGLACEITADRSCVIDGTSYSNGSARCENGVRFVCSDGRWNYVNRGCGDIVSTASRSMDTCTLGGATIAQGSSICREGVTFRCSDGTWVNVGTACR